MPNEKEAQNMPELLRMREEAVLQRELKEKN